MLKRKIEKNLLEWKNKKNKKALIVQGMRQTGKTFIIDHFGKNNYLQYININFSINKKFINVFDGDLDIETIKSKFKLFNEFKEIKFDKNLLIFLDEIQDCPNAITALKTFSISNEFDVIASGSFLGIKYKEVGLFPTGYVETLKLKPLDFEEFLWANEINNEILNSLKISYEESKNIEPIIHEQMQKLFKEYIVVGGMPEVVKQYIENDNNLFKIRKAQQEILEMFNLDVMKYASITDKQKIIECFYSIPNQLAKENKKFMFSKIQPNARSKWYYSAINWLIDSEIAIKCNLINNISSPLNAYENNDIFKLYISDTGLLVSMLDESVVEQIMNNDAFIYKGAIYENIVAQMLFANEYKLRYFSRNYSLELDFVISKENSIYAIEVKSGNNRSKSLSTIMNEQSEVNGLVVSNNNEVKTGKSNLTKIPLYLLFLF